MKIAHSYKFDNDFITDVQNNGQVSVTDGVLKASGNTNGDRAIKSFYLPVNGYTRIKVSVMVRAVQGKCNLALDASVDGYMSMTNVSLTSSDSNEWTLLELDAIIPLKYKLCRVTVGRFAGDSTPSEVYFKDIIIEVDGNVTGSNIVLAQGLLRMQNGVPSIRPAVKAFGFGAITYNSATKEVTVPITTELSSGEYAGHPIIHVTGTQDNFIFPLAGGFAGKSFKIKFTNGVDFVDISDKTVYVYISVLL